MLRISILSTLYTRNTICAGSFPRGGARCLSAVSRTFVNGGEAAKTATRESSVHKNNSDVESQFQLNGLRGGRGKTGAVEELNHSCDLQNVIEETAGDALLHQKRQHSPEAALTARLKGLVPATGAGPWRLAVHMLEKGRMDGINDVKAYNVVLKMMVAEERMCPDKLKEIERLFCQMKLDGLDPEVPTYNSVIYGYSLARDEQNARRVYNEMVSKGLQPDQRTMSNMIYAHSWGSVENMRRFVSGIQAKGWRSTRRANNAAINALGRVKDWNGIIEITKVMLENDHKLSEASFTFAIKAAAFQGEVDFARKLLAVRNTVHFRPREELYVSVMVALRNAERNHECLACWRELVLLNGLGDVIVNEKTYNLVLRVAVKIEQWDEMEVILDMMQEKNAVLSEETYLAVLDPRNVEEGEYMTRLDRVLDGAQRRKMVPSGRVLLSAAMAYARAERWQKAMHMFDRAVARGCILDRRATELLVQALVALKKYAEVKEFWGRCYNAPGGVRALCAGTLRKMVMAARELGDADWRMELLSLGQSDGRSGTSVCEEMPTILTTSGSTEAAMTVAQTVMKATDAAGQSDVDREDALRTPNDALALATMAQDENGEVCYPRQSAVEAEDQELMGARELVSWPGLSRYKEALR